MEEASEERVEFFNRRFKDTKLRIQSCPGKGVGAFTTSRVDVGDVLLREDPAGAFQWRPQPLACDHCLRLLDSLDFQMQLLMDPASRPSASTKTILPDLEKNERFLSETKKGWAPWREEGWFCSAQCEADHVKDFGQLKGQEPLVREFVQHAVDTRTPFFVIALKAMLKDPALMPNLLQRPYWECVDLPDLEDPEEYIEEMKDDLLASWTLLERLQVLGKPQTMHEYACAVGALCRNAVAIKYAHPIILYIQEVDQGRGGVEAKRDLAPLLVKVRAERLKRAERVRAANAGPDDSGTESDGAESESDLEDDELNFSWSPSDQACHAQLEFSSRLFPPLKGHGLFPRLSAVNHSCDPNAEVLFPNMGALLLIARKSIEAGQEVFISYVDAEQEDAKLRQKDLQAYGFTCDCPRCKAQRRKASKKRKVGKTVGKNTKRDDKAKAALPSRASKVMKKVKKPLPSKD